MALMALVVQAASAYDFMAGDIAYNINSDGNTVTVTYQHNSGPAYHSPSYSSLSGAINIPESVTYSGKTYSVTSIGDKAFWGCSGLPSVTIPNSVTSIGEYAFSGCTRLTSVTIPNSVTSIGICAFYECYGLTSVTIPNSVTSIGSRAFEGCTRLKSVTIGNSVTSIGNYAFRGCSGLTSIKVESGNSVYDSRENCNAIIETATNTLISGCKNTIIPNSVTKIGNHAFDECTGLTSITIPNSVTSIGDYAFYYCSGLTSITIPNSVTEIGIYVFRGCSGLTRIDAYPNPAKVSLGSGVFYNVPKDGTLHVLPKYLSAYQTASQWSDFTNIVADLSDGVTGDTNNDNEVNVTDVVGIANYVMGSIPNSFIVDNADVNNSFIVDNADVNNSGSVDVSDVVKLANIVMGE